MTLQLSFSLRVSSGVKTVHLIGSWDGYNNQLPLSKDKTSSKSGSWKGTFKFHAGTVDAGERYWYYFLVDGYHCAANPSQPSTVEPTTGRELNILDVPEDAATSAKSSSRHGSSKSSSKHSSSSSSKHSSSSSSSKHSSSSSSKHSSSSSRDKDRKSHRSSADVPRGRPLSSSDIKSPKPVSPSATKNILKYQDEDALAERFSRATLEEYDDTVEPIIDANSSSASSSLLYRSDSSSSGSNTGSGYSTPRSDYGTCSCERYGITRRGERVKIDCGGAVCGYDDASECSSGSDGEYEASPVSRRGVVIQ